MESADRIFSATVVFTSTDGNSRPIILLDNKGSKWKYKYHRFEAAFTSDRYAYGNRWYEIFMA